MPGVRRIGWRSPRSRPAPSRLHDGGPEDRLLFARRARRHARQDPGSNCYIHAARGPCPCGEEHALADPDPVPGERRSIVSTSTATPTARSFTRRSATRTPRHSHSPPDRQRPIRVEPEGDRDDPLQAPAAGRGPRRAGFGGGGGEDVDRLLSLGCVATCNPMGAKKWRDHYSERFGTATPSSSSTTTKTAATTASKWPPRSTARPPRSG